LDAADNGSLLRFALSGDAEGLFSDLEARGFDLRPESLNFTRYLFRAAEGCLKFGWSRPYLSQDPEIHSF
jgi:hypothetical protein